MCDGRELDEGRGGGLEDLLGVLVRQDLDGLAHALQLHGAQAAALVPLGGLDLAAFLRHGEELLIGRQLRLGGILQLLALGELLQLRGVVGLLLLQGRLQGLEFLLLRRHEFLEGLLRIRLLGVRLLQVAGEGVVHAFEDALDLRGLRRIVAEGVVAGLRGAHAGGAAVREVAGVLQEVADHLDVAAREPARGAGPLQDLSDARDNAEELHLLGGLQELAGTRARQGLGGRLQGTNALLALGPLAAVLLELAVAHALRLPLHLEVLSNLPLELLDLGAVGGNLRLELHNQGLQLLDERSLVADVLRLPGQGFLAPAGVLVVGLLLHLAVGLDAGLHLAQQLRDLRHWRLLLQLLPLQLRAMGLGQAQGQGQGHGGCTQNALHCAEGGAE
mmetsp:Transcript_81261/g.228911  ORF Transcript_81261/g.228911 Transcript_81261/m.228911 type:complete len:389 (+) Transcript_81261:1087-2253(+)